jgi:hypothetical protein
VTDAGSGSCMGFSPNERTGAAGCRENPSRRQLPL